MQSSRLLPLSVSSMTASVHRQPSFYQPRSTAALPSSQTMGISMNCPNANGRGGLVKRDTLSCDDIIDHCNNNSENDNNSANNTQKSCQRPTSSQIRNSNGNSGNPYAKISLEKLNLNSNLGFIVATPPHHPHGSHAHQHHNNSSNNSMSQSYHPHSIFYGQQYHRIQPQQQSFCVNQQMAPLPPQPPPLRLTDSFEQLSVIQRHSGSSFRSSTNTNTSSQQSPPNSVLMTDSITSTIAGDITILENTHAQMVSENPYECIPAQFKNHVPQHPTDQAEAVTRFDSN